MFARMASQVHGRLSDFQINFKEEVRPKLPIQPIQTIRKKESGTGSKSGRKKSKILSNPPSKKTRRGTLKSKSGCQTCKFVYKSSSFDSASLTQSRIRHTKCDELWPACKRCTETGRNCDYTDLFRVSISPPVPPPRRSSLPTSKSRASAVINHPTGHTRPTAPLPAFEISEQDGHYFQYIHCLSSTNMTDVFDNALWNLVLQASTIEPCIRHVALGMAMLHQIYGFIVINPSDPTYLEIYYAGMKHYSKAVKALKERLAEVKGKADSMIWEISLLASFLFTGFEVLVGNEYGAYWQMYSGFKLMKSALAQHDMKSNALSLPGNLRALTLAWNRLDIQATTFSLWYETKAMLAPSIPDSFSSLSHAKDVLDVITSNSKYSRINLFRTSSNG